MNLKIAIDGVDPNSLDTSGSKTVLSSTNVMDENSFANPEKVQALNYQFLASCVFNKVFTRPSFMLFDRWKNGWVRQIGNRLKWTFVEKVVLHTGQNGSNWVDPLTFLCPTFLKLYYGVINSVYQIHLNLGVSIGLSGRVWGLSGRVYRVLKK